VKDLRVSGYIQQRTVEYNVLLKDIFKFNSSRPKFCLQKRGINPTR